MENSFMDDTPEKNTAEDLAAAPETTAQPQFETAPSRPRRKHRKHHRPRQSEVMKKLWADPAYRAKHERHFAARRADPTKAWSRKNVPNGWTRETAAAAKEEAKKKAEEVFKALKELGYV